MPMVAHCDLCNADQGVDSTTRLWPNQHTVAEDVPTRAAHAAKQVCLEITSLQVNEQPVLLCRACRRALIENILKNW